MDYLQKELARLAKLTTVIKESGPIAPANCWVDLQKPSGRKVTYARKRSKVAMFPSGKKVQGLGKVGSDEHQAFELEIQRRNALEEISRRVIALQKMIDNPLWEPGAPPLELDQTEYVPPATVPPSKPVTKKARKPVTLTHMKTKAGSRVHAIKGELNGDKRSYKAALCGAKPPGNTLGWEIPAMDPHIVSCPKCFKKLPADYRRHIPEL